jgi:hypothetical protein
MNPPTRRKCRHCRQAFIPDYRNAYHQMFCSTPACQHASRQTSQRRWLRKPENRNYFRELDNLERVRQWRQSHPGYWRAACHRCQRPKDQHSANITPAEEISTQTCTLQDFCRGKTRVLIDLVSRLGRCALQEDIARWASQLVTEAQCILVRCQVNILPRRQLELPINYHESG